MDPVSAANNITAFFSSVLQGLEFVHLARSFGDDLKAHQLRGVKWVLYKKEQYEALTTHLTELIGQLSSSRRQRRSWRIWPGRSAIRWEMASRRCWRLPTRSTRCSRRRRRRSSRPTRRRGASPCRRASITGCSWA
ncbi:uncharacterized protein P884DRAFT_261520 [Thermothelomyces heterothallicus CBS 202.75]|uniref:uncharacterized protein n=1 Tax=Thermothelomyces heterothallicus CBS 202.75 TaxID=1149848 RepID=UPI0037443AE9